jgi:hypothetical protein
MATLEQTALVAAAEDPLDNRTRLGAGRGGWVRILVAGDAPIYTAARFKLDRDHWLVRGQEISVKIDPAAPQDFEIVWDQVASIEQRAAANAPSLADPIGSYRRVLTALIVAGVAGQGAAAPGQISAGQIVRGALGGVLPGRSIPQGGDPFATPLHAHAELFERGDKSPVVGNFEKSMQKIAAAPAPAGKLRAGVLFSAHAATMKTSGGAEGAGMNSYPERQGKHEVVLSVHVPGRDPYAVHVGKFKHEKGKVGEFMAALPALVSATDPSDVVVLWDEMLSSREFSKQVKANARGMVAERKAALRTAQQGGQPGALPGGVDAMAGYKQSARAALAATANSPASRRMVIGQYRSLGVKISDEGEVED